MRLTRIPKRGRVWKLRAACVLYCADLGCPRITPRFIQNAPRDSILIATFDSVPAALMKVELWRAPKQVKQDEKFVADKTDWLNRSFVH